ncbi:MAG: PIG-L family deacetylase [Actinobacteria bacterium]|nr:PIG-L family deacetylase [Actinomycetota bacterium]
MNKRTGARDNPALKDSAIIFAPHPDDETLGCGGTIIKKIHAGANVQLVFMTDGRNSHRHLMPAGELVAKRKQEAIAAARVLGLDESNLFFLGFKDAKLESLIRTAIPKVVDILKSTQLKQVYLPYIHETPADHIATRTIVLESLAQFDQNFDVFEYPIWFWSHWPWMHPQFGSRREILSIIKNSLSAEWHLHKDFNCSLDISQVIEKKRAALEKYQSQMTRLVPDEKWLTLADISDGEFLQCFFQEYEYFYQYKMNKKMDT